MTEISNIIYLARGRLQRPRANLIQTLHTVEALTRAGAETRLFLPPVPGRFDMPAFLASMGIGGPIDIRPTLSLHGRWGGWPFFLLHRRELMRADAVYTRVPAFSLMMARLGQAHFLEVHDTHTLDAQGYIPRLLREDAKGVLRGITAISANARQALLAKGFPEDHVAVLPSGVDLEVFSEIALPGLEDFVAPKPIYVGRISRDRGLPLFERIAESGFPVTIVGPRDHEPTHAHPNLTVLDPIPHAAVPGALGCASIALMPYQADLRHAASISPIKLFEALAAGRLVLASDLPSIREVVCDGKNGLLLPPDNPESWVAAIEKVRTNPAWALEMAKRGRETAREYSWSARARNLLNFMESTSR